MASSLTASGIVILEPAGILGLLTASVALPSQYAYHVIQLIIVVP